MKFPIVWIRWKDVTGATNVNRDADTATALLTFVSIGFKIGEFKDKENVPFVRLCYKFNASGDDQNDFIDIPSGLIMEEKEVGSWGI